MRWLFLLVLIVLPGALFAEKRVALVIGNDRYETLRPLENAGNDAVAVAGALEELGFEVILEPNRDLRRMRRALEDLEYDGEGADVALVYFAGHGFEVAGENRILPIDGDATDAASLAATSVSLNDVRALVARIAPVGIVLVDACRNDPFAAGTGAGRGGVALKAGDLGAGFAPVDRSAGTLVGFATAPGDTASDGADGNSPFARALVTHLKTPGLEVRSVLTLVQQEVYDRTRGDQLPYVESALPRLFFAAQSADDLPERERLLLAMAGLKPDLRAEVERVAAEADMPLAPLYGALIGAGLDRSDASDRAKKLAEAARAYTETRQRLRTLSAEDPEVARLRGVASDWLDLGDFTGAMAALDLAVERDGASGARLEANLVARRVSQAESLQLKAGVAESALDYPTAIAALSRAAELHAGIAGLDVADADRRKRTWLLAGLGDLHMRLGDTGAAAESFTGMRRAAEDRLKGAPNRTDALRDLAVAQSSIGDVRSAQGNLNEALAAYEAGLEIIAGVSAQNPGDTGFLRDVSVSYGRVGDVRREQGDIPGAQSAYEESFKIRKRLAALEPESAERLQDLSISYNKIGDMRLTRGDLIGAVNAFEAGFEIIEKLVRNAPNDVALIRSLSVSYERIGDVRVDMGDLAAAASAYEAGLEVSERLAAKDPENTLWQRDMSVSLQKIGDVRFAQGDLDGALSAYKADWTVSVRLAEKDRDNSVWQRDLSVSYFKIGDLFVKQQNWDGALDAYYSGHEIRERLAAKDPGNLVWQRDLSIGYVKIGDAHRIKRDLNGALAAYEIAHAIRERLSASDPDNKDWQQDLSFSHNKIGDVHKARGDLSKAVASYEAGFRIRAALAAEGPQNADWQRDLLVSHFLLAAAGQTPRHHYQTALEIAERMARDGILAPSDAFIPGLIRDRLAALPHGSP